MTEPDSRIRKRISWLGSPARRLKQWAQSETSAALPNIEENKPASEGITRRQFNKIAVGATVAAAAHNLTIPAEALAELAGDSWQKDLARVAFKNAVDNNLIPAFEAACDLMPSYHNNRIEREEKPVEWLAEPMGFMLGLSAFESGCDPNAINKPTKALGHMQILRSTFRQWMALSDKDAIVESLKESGEEVALAVYEEVRPFIALNGKQKAELKSKEYSAWCKEKNVNWNQKTKQPAVALSERVHNLRKTAVASLLYAENLEREEQRWSKNKPRTHNLPRGAQVFLRHNFGEDAARVLLKAGANTPLINIRGGGAQRFSKYLLKVNNLSPNVTVGQIVARADYTSKLIPNMRKLYLKWKKNPELFEQPKPVPAAQPKNACKKCAGPTPS